MSIYNIISNMPGWYLAAMIIFSVYYAIRGVLYYKVYYASVPALSSTEKVIIVYIQEVLFKIIITMSSFICVYILSLQKAPFNEISIGTTALLLFLFIWGTIGVSGYLTAFIAAGRIPGLKQD